MAPITSVFFWFDGVLAPPLWHLARVALEAHNVRADASLGLTLIELGRKVRAGAMSWDAYWREVSELASAPLSPEQLAAAVENRIAATPGILDVVEELGDVCHLYMLFDYPQHWVLPSLSRTGLARHFPEQRIVIAELYGDTADPNLVFDRLPHLQVSPQELLLVDSDPVRAMALFRLGLKTAIFVDARRLRRDLAVWKMLPPVTHSANAKTKYHVNP